ncbi:sugar phosphate isomerase/epimerase [Chitinophagaceae bacterium LB-8]|uniref:Sugar phosphate isomerase/epimerase n=1 Tax=Paraflavisolibacter caeni TaxID=2982496 RepID=A0A9X2Y0P6_9BACT|nr:sugar phosphate isomerase/epimerase [Paraflavisolibacter caeni]MCU7552242.1 sugar phosphate isomerase/epimerase [Paraflavisolibacter caeni]
MSIQYYCPRWGSESLSWGTFFENVMAAGYDGVECGIAVTASEKELEEIWNLSAKHNVKIIIQHYDTYVAEFSKHFDQYCAWLEKVKPYPCVKINSQTGKDFFSFEQNQALIEETLRFTENEGVPVVHETHRNKFSFAAHITKTYLEKIPGLKITLDASHWVCVAESFLEDQPQAVNLAIEKTEHIHARVGYIEGPQVPDPRINEWEHALNMHLNWWDKVVERKKKENAILTIAPEFGPFPYMVPLPSTGQPITNQWEVNLFMMNLLKKRYSNTSL